MHTKTAVRQPTLSDYLICGYNHIYFSVKEQVILKINRLRFSNAYKNIADKPLVSVYIPTYNRSKLLMERSVPSVLAQTYHNFELIIIGDCCTDDTRELVLKIKDPRVKFYNLPVRKYRYPPTAENHWLAGPVVAANKALELVNGDWIARIDDDDFWVPEHLERLLHFAYEGDYEFVSSEYIEERFGQRILHRGNGLRDPYYTRKPITPKGYNPKIGCTSSWVYRSYLRFFRYNINCWRKRWNRVNDIDISLRMFNARVRVGFLERALTYVLPRPGEQTVGLHAYKLSEQEKIRHFEFNT